jgi:superfamily II RNA helicase
MAHLVTREAEQLVEEFATTQPFALDPFQHEACLHLAQGRSVLVAAPTGTGKTVVAELAIWLARRAGVRAIYTAPLKALSNQKYRDLRARHGAAEVGLMTGDIVEYPTAPIVVMTTEIYRNMLLEGSRAARSPGGAAPTESARASAFEAGERRHDSAARQLAMAAADFARQAALDEELSSVGCVIFDELHYLSDPERGPVWEEAIIHSPAHVTLVGLSATVGNADQLCRWITQVHGPSALVLHVERAVPLEHYFYLDGRLHLVQNAAGQRVERFPGIGGEAKLARERARPRVYVSEGEAPAPQGGVFLAAGAGARAGVGAEARSEEGTPVRREAPQPSEVLSALRTASLLPCLYFLPGRRAVETAAESAAAHLLVSAQQRARLHEEVQEWVRALPPEDQRLDQVRRLAALLPRGLAFHHAGLLPGLKVMVETLFARGDLRAVFATDTLALGINMPARSVVLGSLSKFDGTQMRLLTPNEYQQLTGRAGRRGMDERGAAVIPYSPWDAFEPAFAQLTGLLQPVISAFVVRYNTVLNLWRPGDLARLRAAVAASLREFQRRGVERRLARRDARADKGRALARAHLPAHGLSRVALAELNATILVLRSLGHIGEDDRLTLRGRLLRALFHPAGMVLTELVLTDALDGLGPAELAEVVSWFTFDDDRSLRNLNTPPRRLVETRHAIYRVLRLVQGMEYDFGITLSPGMADDFYGIALNWWRGMSLGGLLRRVDLAEGDLLVALNQTIDLLQQLQGAIGQALDARDLWDASGRVPASTPHRRSLEEAHERLARLRPALEAAWRGLLRGSVAQSRAVPSMVTPTPEAILSPDEVPLGHATVSPATIPVPMAEDEEPVEALQDRLASPGGPGLDVDRPPE